MKDILIDTILDSIKLLPFLFVAFYIIELFEHKFAKKTREAITNSKKFGPIVGSFLGIIPQCGFSVVATNLYVTRILSLGTLISVYLSTSDEMLPILISHNAPPKDILTILGVKVLIGTMMGFIIDLIIRKKDAQEFSICESDKCDCEESLIKSTLIHTIRTFLFIFLITLVLNILMSYLSEEILTKIFMTNSIFAPFLSCLIGLIPNCAPSVLITELYLSGVIKIGTCIAGLLTNSGLALIVLFKTNDNIKEDIIILTLIYIVGVISGIIINLI